MSETAERKKMKCPYCGYEWVPRTADPKKCPRCGHWLPGWRR
jgi:rubrerythrin